MSELWVRKLGTTGILNFTQVIFFPHICFTYKKCPNLCCQEREFEEAVRQTEIKIQVQRVFIFRSFGWEGRVL